MMQTMMNKMIASLSPQEKEDLLLKMMPQMMKDVDLNKMVPKMLVEMGKVLNAYGIVDFFVKAAKSDDIKKALTGIKSAMESGMPEMMPAMMPIMKDTMPKIMGSVMPMMAPMMKEMSKSGDCIMGDVVDDKPEMKPVMGEMMMKMMPKMAGKVIPEDKGQEFIENMTQAVVKNSPNN
jgi:hypothetical protein